MDLFGSRLNTSPIDPRVIEEANRRMQRQVMIDTSPVGQVRAVGDTTLVGGVPIQPQAQRGGLSLQGMLDVASMAPGIGDFIGPLNDAQRLYRNPEERTPLNFGLAGLGALPFLPSMLGGTKLFRAADSAAGHYWSPDIDVARAYRFNPGRGGSNLYQSKMPELPIMDIGAGGFESLAKDSGVAGDLYGGAFEAPVRILDDDRVRSYLRENGFGGVSYLDDFPNGANTVFVLEPDDISRIEESPGTSLAKGLASPYKKEFQKVAKEEMQFILEDAGVFRFGEKIPESAMKMKAADIARAAVAAPVETKEVLEFLGDGSMSKGKRGTIMMGGEDTGIEHTKDFVSNIKAAYAWLME